MTLVHIWLQTFQVKPELTLILRFSSSLSSSMARRGTPSYANCMHDLLPRIRACFIKTMPFMNLEEQAYQRGDGEGEIYYVGGQGWSGFNYIDLAWGNFGTLVVPKQMESGNAATAMRFSLEHNVWQRV
ncbi:unnamed protein product [Dovyalis caffra]|uniref:Uncharacterized protein n=1 Tax=Dovyalis caffra TaxID=77055 RepID=A0AAV1SPN0_9ROSI|nr:unnamed protein product [Dovyalis caffra]